MRAGDAIASKKSKHMVAMMMMPMWTTVAEVLGRVDSIKLGRKG